MSEKYSSIFNFLNSIDTTIIYLIIILLVIVIVVLLSVLKRLSGNKEYYKKHYTKEKNKTIYPDSYNTNYYEMILDDVNKYYKVRNSIFSPSEQTVYYYIKNYLKDYKDFIVFPKVRLADFIDTNEDVLENLKQNGEYKFKDSIISSITSKHVDYLICKIIYNQNNLIETIYKPILVIELDGKSHFKAENYRQIKNDNFKNEVLPKLGFKFKRFKSGVKRKEIEDYLINFFDNIYANK